MSVENSDYLKQNISIPLRPEAIEEEGLSNRQKAEKVAFAIDDPGSFIHESVSSVLQREQRHDDLRTYDDLRDTFGKMKLSVRREDSGMYLDCAGVPESVLVFLDGQLGIMERQATQVANVIRDLAFPVEGEDRVSAVKAMVKRAGLLEGDPRNKTFVWGGHKVDDQQEYDFSKTLSYYDVIANQTELTTGCGPGHMKSPFRGAQAAHQERGFDGKEHRFIGLSEPRIIGVEAPNRCVSDLVVFPNIAERMTGFMKTNHRGRIEEGGVGTAQEILIALSTMSHEENMSTYYPLDVVGMPGGSYIPLVQDYLHTILNKKTVDSILTFHDGPKPKDFARHVYETNKEADNTQMWRDDLFIPSEVVAKNPDVSFEYIEGLDFSSNLSQSELIKSYEQLMDALVCVSVKYPEIAKAWGSDKPKLSGPKAKMRATLDFLKALNQQGRIRFVDSEIPVRID